MKELSLRFKIIVSTIIQLIRSGYEKFFNYSILYTYDSVSQNSFQVLKITKYDNIFCGYYDVSPFNPFDSDLIALHATNLSAYAKNSILTSVDILVYRLSSQEVINVDHSSAWNWQQGSRLQWVDQKSLIYNVIHEGYVRAKKTCITNGSSEIFPIPISILNGVDGFASIDYFAMTEGSEYGYPGIKCESFNSRVQYYRFSDQTITTFFDWRELSPKLLIAGATKEHINHILFAPNGKYFVYIHRFWVNKRRFDSLIGFDIDKKTLEPIITNQTVSHYCWKDDSTLFAWLIINGNPGYYYIDILTKEYTLVYAEDDGHPNWLFGDVYITDRYVGSRFGGNLLQAEIVNLSTKKNFPLVKLSHPAILDYSHRCDMHISISNNKSRFQLDSRHLHNKRTVIVGCLPDLCRNTSLYHL